MLAISRARTRDNERWNIMNKNDLIARQQIEIEELKKTATISDTKKAAISHIIYAIGAPLNDSKLNYTKEQRRPFHRIAEILDL